MDTPSHPVARRSRYEFGRDTEKKTRKLRVLLGLSMLGEGLICAVAPHRYPMLWKIKDAPDAYDELMDYMGRHRTVTRSIALMEMATGLWMALDAVEELPEK